MYSATIDVTPPDSTVSEAKGFRGVQYAKVTVSDKKVPLLSGYGIYTDLCGLGMAQFGKWGQYEAGAVLGMTRSQTFFKVVLLQVIKRIIPPMGNEIITLVKDTSLARTITAYEIIWAAQKFIKLDGIIWPLFYSGAFYLIFSGVLTLFFGWIEKKLDYFKS